MEKQERKQEPRREPQGKEEVKANPKVVEAGKKLKEDIDKLVDETVEMARLTSEDDSGGLPEQSGSTSHLG